MHRAAFCCRKTSSAAIAHAQGVMILDCFQRFSAAYLVVGLVSYTFAVESEGSDPHQIANAGIDLYLHEPTLLAFPPNFQKLERKEILPIALLCL